MGTAFAKFCAQVIAYLLPTFAGWVKDWLAKRAAKAAADAKLQQDDDKIAKAIAEANSKPPAA